MSTNDLAYLARRPGAGTARPYDFPAFTRGVLDGGLTVVACHVPGRPLLSAQLIIRGDTGGGATSEPAALGGVTSQVLPGGVIVVERGRRGLLEGHLDDRVVHRPGDRRAACGQQAAVAIQFNPLRHAHAGLRFISVLTDMNGSTWG